jgi:putative oxidoreductase
MKQSLRTLLLGGVTPPERMVDLSWTVLRVAAGGLMAPHGFAKLPISADFVQGVGSLGFPAPLVFAWAAALSELVGGLLLALGLFTRPAAFLIGCTMTVAAFLALAGKPLEARELPLLFLAVMVPFVVQGSGRFSVDALLRT